MKPFHHVGDAPYNFTTIDRWSLPEWSFEYIYALFTATAFVAPPLITLALAWNMFTAEDLCSSGSIEDTMLLHIVALIEIAMMSMRILDIDPNLRMVSGSIRLHTAACEAINLVLCALQVTVCLWTWYMAELWT